MPTSRSLRSGTEKKKGPDIIKKDKDDFIITSFPDKGKGVLAASHIEKGEDIMEYSGIIRTDAPEESEDDTYIFECYLNGKQYWIDATFDDGSLGRLINDDVKSPNIKPKLQCINGEPHIYFYAIKDIEPMEELLYSYGGGPYPWRSNKKQKKKELASKKPKNSGFVVSGFTFSEDQKSDFRKVAINARKEFTYHELFTAEVTHVIMSEDPCDRTTKYLQGLTHRCWILNKNWVLESIKSGYLLPEENYEICGDKLSGVCHGPQKSRLSSTGILKNFKIYVEGTRTDLDIRQLVCDMSGTLTDTKEDCNLILVTKEQDDITTEDTKLLKEYTRKCRKDITTMEWLLDSLCTWTVQNIGPYVVDIFPDNDIRSQDSTDPSSTETDNTSETDDDPLYQPSGSETDKNCVENSADSDGSEQIPFMDLNSLKQLKSNNSGITVKKFSRSTEGKKVWDKKHYCLYCKKPFSKLPRHLETMHKNETDVVALRSLDRRKNEHKEKRAILIEKLRNAGNYNHNMDVLSSGEGEVVTKKSLSKAKDSAEYLPCKYCLGFYFKNDLYRHVKKCVLREEKLSKGTRHQSNSVFFLPSTVSERASQDFQKDVVADMIVDNVSLCARNDKLIILFGEKLYRKHKALTHMHQYVRTKMRELSRFLLKSRELDKNIITLSDCISGKNFVTCVTAVQLLCGIDCSKRADIPSLALKVGHSLSKCANIMISQALIEGDAAVQDEAERFLKLYSLEWNNEISATALKTLETRKWNRPSLLPLTNDIVKLKTYLDKELDHNMTLLNNKNMQGWRPLCESLLVSVILFNRRRSGEVEKMTLEVYSMKSKSEVLPEVMECLTSVEKQLVRNFSRVEIRGKKGRKVPVLLPEKEDEALGLLVQNRQTAGIEKSNPYVFANTTLGYIRGTDCMRNKASKAELENPEHIRSTNLRKHVATLSQVVHLRDNELDMLAQFLGHDIKVHRNFYRLPEDTLQTAKVGKLLMAVNKGNIKNYAGKSLDDIAADQEVSEESESNDSDEEDQADDVVMDSDDPMAGIVRKADEFGKNRSIGQNRRNPWSREEKKAVTSEFGQFLRIMKVPGKLDCDRCLRNKPCLSRRNWKDIKNFVHNKIQSMKKWHHN